MKRIVAITIIITFISSIALRDMSFAEDQASAATSEPTQQVETQQTEPVAVDTPTQVNSNSTSSVSATSYTYGPPYSWPSVGASAFGLGAFQTFQNDLFSGRAKLSVSITVPPGRKGIQPNIALTYASGSGNDILGWGWTLELGSIQRSVKSGVPGYNASDKFVLNLGGAQVDLVFIGNNEYRAKIEELFMKFVYNGTRWEVTDKSGTKYIYGSKDTSRQTNVKGTFKWCLDKVVDLNDNSLSIDYFNEDGYVYPQKIEYTANEIKGNVAASLVDFTYSSRQDARVSYRSGVKVETNKRLSEIKIYQDNSLVRKYILSYKRPSIFSFLESISVVGSDGETSQPPMTFTYIDNVNSSFLLVDNFRLPVYFTDSELKMDNGVRLADLNRDGFMDIAQAEGTDKYGTWINNHGIFVKDVNFTVPRMSNGGFTDSYPASNLDNGARFADLNGDGFMDITQYDMDGRDAEIEVFFNNGVTFVKTPYYESPISFTKDYSKDNNVRLVDLNDDGLVDLIESGGNSAWLNNGINGFTRTSGFVLPAISDGGFTKYDEGLIDNGVRLVDLNGDGLVDILHSNGCSQREVWLNTGRGFEQTSYFAPPSGCGNGFTAGDRDSGVRVADINGDGLPDLVKANGANERAIWFNNGKYFVSIGETGDYSSYKIPIISGGGFTESTGIDNGVVAIDINGDNLTDLVQSDCCDGEGQRKSYLNTGGGFGLLTTVNNGIGGQLQISYKPSTQYDNTGGDGISDLGFPVYTVSSITSSDGQGHSYTTRYEYKNGMYSYTEREFRGFGYVKVIDADGNYTVNYFKQDDIYKGKLEKQETYNAGGELFAKTENLWASQQPVGAPGSIFPYLSEATFYVYDGQANPKRTKTSTQYEFSYGNVIRTTNYGDLDVSGDEIQTIIDYNFNEANHIVGLAERITVVDAVEAPWNVVSVKELYYDGHNGTPGVPPTKGLLTEQRDECYNPLTGVTQKARLVYTHDDYGNNLTQTAYSNASPYERTTTTTYEQAYNIYPVTVTDALGHATHYTYDYKTGQVLTAIDINNQLTTNIYDALGRLKKVIGPNDTEQQSGIAYEYYLTQQPTKIEKRVKSTYSPFNQLISYQFYDGLGRLIETKSPAQNSNQQIISEVVTYDQRGQVKEKYLPYFVDTSGGTSGDYIAPTYAQYHAIFDYDAMERLIRTTNPDTTYSTIEYSQWIVSTIDENGHKITKYADAFGRVIKVEEYAGADGRSADYPLQAYSLYSTTSYEYDKLGNLTKLTDNQNNITQIWYDTLSRKIKMDDPDMGVWLYEYDLVGNLIKQTDAKGQALTFEYDAINRLITKKGLSPQGTVPVVLATYTYDTGTNGIGRLGKVTDQLGSTEFFYDNLGREIKSIKTVDGTSYTVERIYDALDRLVTLKYPDTSTIKYEYNPQGIEKISQVSPTACDIVKDINYTETSQIKNILYANNNTYTEYDYNPLTLRLRNIKTETASGTDIQNLTYQFDNVGNIKSIADPLPGHNSSQVFLYDHVDRLIQAQGNYGAFTYGYDTIGNMTNKEGASLTYGQAGRLPHAVTQYGSKALDYDLNGNMIKKENLELTYDTENRLTQVEDKTVSNRTTVNLALTAGWNFISLPVVPDDASISSVFAAIAGKYDQVSRYNAATAAFESYVGNSKYDQFNTLEYGRGYQIYITDPNGASLTVSGTIPQSSSVQLKTGYNLIFSPKTTDTSVEQALSPLKLGVDYSKVFHYNKSSAVFEKYDASTHEFTTFKPGESYYLYCLKDATWQIANTNPATTFVYDGDGGRVKKTIGDNSTTYIGSLFEKDASGKTTKNVFSGSTRICAVESTGVKYYYHSDHLGSSNVITNDSGVQASFTEFTPYGTTHQQTGTYDPRYKFTGKELDASTGMYFYGARYYDHEIGRFISPDTIIQAPYDPQSLSRYTYCRNNPLKYIDPTGHEWSWGSFFGWFGNMFSSIGSWFKGENIAIPYQIIQNPISSGQSSGYSIFSYDGQSLITVDKSLIDTEHTQWLESIYARDAEFNQYADKMRTGYALNINKRDTSLTMVMRSLSSNPSSDLVNKFVSKFGPRHETIILDKLPHGKWEMGSYKKMINTTSTVENLSSWETHIATENSLALGGKYIKSFTTQVNFNALQENIALYESTFAGKFPYIATDHNSNFAVNSVIYGAGGDIPDGDWAPGFPDKP